MDKEAKEALLVVSYGTAEKESFRESIAPIEARLARSFKGKCCMRAFTSEAVRKRLLQRGEAVHSVEEALDCLAGFGIKRLSVQPTLLQKGGEWEKLLAVIREKSGAFDKIILGRPLVSSYEDLCAVITAVCGELPLTDGEYRILVGHGAQRFDGSLYARWNALKGDSTRALVLMLKGEPGLEALTEKLREAGIQKVLLAPLFLCRGEHASRDLFGAGGDSVSSKLMAMGFGVRHEEKSLGESPLVQSLFADHLGEAEADGGEGVLCR